MPVLETLALGFAVKHGREAAQFAASAINNAVTSKVRDIESRNFALASGVLSQRDGEDVCVCVEAWLHDRIEFHNPALKALFQKLSPRCGLARIQSDGVPLVGNGTQTGWQAIQIRNPLSQCAAVQEDVFGFVANALTAIDEYYATHPAMNKEKAYVIILDNYLQVFLGMMRELKNTPGQEAADAFDELEAQLKNLLNNFKKGPAQQRTATFLNRIAQSFAQFETGRVALCSTIQQEVDCIIAQARADQKKSAYQTIVTLSNQVTQLSTHLRQFVITTSNQSDAKRDLFSAEWNHNNQEFAVKNYQTETLQSRCQALQLPAILTPADQMMLSITTMMILCEEARRIMDGNQNNTVSLAQLHTVINGLLQFSVTLLKQTIPNNGEASAATRVVHCRSLSLINQSYGDVVCVALIEMDKIVGKIRENLIEIQSKLTENLSPITDETLDTLCGGRTEMSNLLKHALPELTVNLHSPLGARLSPLRDEDPRAERVRIFRSQTDEQLNERIVHCIQDLKEEDALELSASEDRVTIAKDIFLQNGGQQLLNQIGQHDPDDLINTYFIRLIAKGILSIDAHNKLQVDMNVISSKMDVYDLCQYLFIKLRAINSSSQLIIKKFLLLDFLSDPERELYDQLCTALEDVNMQPDQLQVFLNDVENRFKPIIEKIKASQPIGHAAFFCKLDRAILHAKTKVLHAEQAQKIQALESSLSQCTLTVDSLDLLKSLDSGIKTLERDPQLFDTLFDQVTALRDRLTDMTSEVDLHRSLSAAFDGTSAEFQQLMIEENFSLQNAGECLHKLSMQLDIWRRYHNIPCITPKQRQVYEGALTQYQKRCRSYCEELVDALEHNVQRIMNALESEREGFNYVSTQRYLNTTDSAETAIPTGNLFNLESKKDEIAEATTNCVAKVDACLKMLAHACGMDQSENSYMERVTEITDNFMRAAFEHTRNKLVETLNAALRKIKISTNWTGLFTTPLADVPEIAIIVGQINASENVQQLSAHMSTLINEIHNKGKDPVEMLCSTISTNHLDSSVALFLQAIINRSTARAAVAA